MPGSNSSSKFTTSDSSFTIEWTRLYRGSENEFSAAAFHRLCEDQGPTVVLVKSTSGRMAAGYSCVSWNNSQNLSPNPRGFLCAIDTSDNSLHIFKGDRDCKIYCLSDYGPVFFNGMHIGDKNVKSYSKLGTGFESGDDEFALFGSYNFTVVEYEVFGIKF